MKALPQAIAGANFREVERRDARYNTERLAHGIDVDARAGAVAELALQEMRNPAGEFDDLDATLNVALGVGDRLAVLARERVGEAVGFLRDQLEKFEEDARTALRVGRGPGRLRGFRVLDRGTQLCLRSERHLGDDVAGHRLEDIAGAA
jgi:hypothetical protein